MMRRLIHFIAAIVAIVLSTSCTEDVLRLFGCNGGVTFVVQVPEAPVTKGTIAAGAVIADGTNVNELHYAVYKTETQIKSLLAQGVVSMQMQEIDGKQVNAATLNLNLVKDQDYTLILWAQVKGAGHYEIGDLREISMKASVAGNDETRAAFYAVYPFDTYRKKDHKVTLTRPFAQLNLLTTRESLAPVQPGQTLGYTVDVKASEVIVNGVATTFSTLEGKAPKSAVKQTFVQAASPEEQGQESLECAGKQYHYVSMNYLFVPENEADISVEYKIVTDKGDVGHIVSNVPVKKNHRTNLVGNLLTSEQSFQIIIDAGFKDPAEYVIVK